MHVQMQCESRLRSKLAYGVAADLGAQEEMLSAVSRAAARFDLAGLQSEVLPRVHSLCLRTSSAAIRARALSAMADLSVRVKRAEADAMLATASQVRLLATSPLCAVPLCRCV